MAVETEKVTKQIKKHKRNKSRVSFEEELINKETATEVLAKTKISDTKAESINEEVKSQKRKSINYTECINEHEMNGIIDVVKKRKKNKKETEIISKPEEQNGNNSNNELVTKKKKKQKKKDKLTNDSEFQSGEFDKSSKNKRKIDSIGTKETDSKKKKTTVSEESEELAEPNEKDPKTPGKTEESIRAKKRKKHQQLMDEKKKKVQLATQENVLNYLSKWKHARDDWKFEKLKQIWLSDNVFDSSKIPDEFWEIVVEYFSGARGFIRNLIVREALKIIESEDKAEEKNVEEEYQSRLKRARDIVQNLQE